MQLHEVSWIGASSTGSEVLWPDPHHATSLYTFVDFRIDFSSPTRSGVIVADVGGGQDHVLKVAQLGVVQASFDM
jgi:hypothetical protein